MQLGYHPAADQLCIDLSSRQGVDSVEVSAGVVLDDAAGGNLCGIDIDHASRKLDLASLQTSHVPPPTAA